MFAKPDYETLRREAGFRWSVGSTYLALLEVTGVPIREFYLHPNACAEVYRAGRPKIREMFGECVALPGVSTPPISYGHANALGAPLLFPEGGEVAHEHPFRSLEAAIQALRRPVDFARAGMAPYYLEFRRTLQQAFPGEPVAFGYGLEGPVTTAYELRGEGFFYDLMDQPQKAKEFLRLATASIIDFHRFRCDVLSAPHVHPRIGVMCDDIASMVPPPMFREHVLPFWDRYYSGVTAGHRTAHIEDLKPDHLAFLEEVGLWNFDPSISRSLNPRIIASKCRVPFGWRLANLHYPAMTRRDVWDFVFQAAADGASSVFTYVCATMCNDASVLKVHAFAEAARDAKRMRDAGADPPELAKMVSPEGRRKFWEQWPEPRAPLARIAG